MARRLLPLTVLTGIFAAVGTGFLVLLFGRDSSAAVLVMLAWICTLCFVIYLLILAVSLFIRSVISPLARRRPTMSGGSAESGCWGARPDAFPCGRP